MDFADFVLKILSTLVIQPFFLFLTLFRPVLVDS